MNLPVLVLNSGSSSIKYSLYQSSGSDLQQLERGMIDRIGNEPTLIKQQGTKKTSQQLSSATNHNDAIQLLLTELYANIENKDALVIGHRIVHGGNHYSQPVKIDTEVLSKLETINSLAPLHQPYNLAAVKAILELDEHLLQVACFDTAFHARQDKPGNQFGIPVTFYDEGIRRYGFHGLSYEYLGEALKEIDPELSKGKVIAAHLGNGASLCAMKNGVSIDSSMGFSALDGLMMGTRCGAIDAGVLLYLLQEKKMDADAISDLLYHRSGLLGVSGISNDMRDLRNNLSPAASEAIELYIHRIISELGKLIAQLEGLDGIIFTGGIGENDYKTREEVCKRMNWLGLELDEEANKQNQCCISNHDSKIKAYIVPANEELMIAKHGLAIAEESLF